MPVMDIFMLYLVLVSTCPDKWTFFSICVHVWCVRQKLFYFFVILLLITITGCVSHYCDTPFSYHFTKSPHSWFKWTKLYKEVFSWLFFSYHLCFDLSLFFSSFVLATGKFTALLSHTALSLFYFSQSAVNFLILSSAIEVCFPWTMYHNLNIIPVR
jgi:hypothetical protein